MTMVYSGCGIIVFVFVTYISEMFDEKEFEIIVKKYYSRIFNYCLSKLDFDEYDSSDITNSVFNLLYEKWNVLDRKDNILAWLYRVADNYVKKHWQKKVKNRIESLEEIIDKGKLEDVSLYSISIDTDVNVNITKELIKISQELPQELKQLFIYRVIENKTFAEIVAITGLPYTTVNNKVEKAKKLAEKIIKKNYF